MVSEVHELFVAGTFAIQMWQALKCSRIDKSAKGYRAS